VAQSHKHYREAERTRTPPKDADILFFLIDFDRFKEVNDAYDHAAGTGSSCRPRAGSIGGLRGLPLLGAWAGRARLGAVVGLADHAARKAKREGRDTWVGLHADGSGSFGPGP
jgi:GGDEF domain-containing protein